MVSCGLWEHPAQFQGAEYGWKCFGDGWKCTGDGLPLTVLYRHRRGGVGLWTFFSPHRSGVFVTLQPDVPWLGTSGGYPSLQRQRPYLPEGLISLYQSPHLICSAAETSSIHTNRGISLKPNLILDHPGWWAAEPGLWWCSTEHISHHSLSPVGGNSPLHGCRHCPHPAALQHPWIHHFQHPSMCRRCWADEMG